TGGAFEECEILGVVFSTLLDAGVEAALAPDQPTQFDTAEDAVAPDVENLAGMAKIVSIATQLLKLSAMADKLMHSGQAVAKLKGDPKAAEKLVAKAPGLEALCVKGDARMQAADAAAKTAASIAAKHAALQTPVEAERAIWEIWTKQQMG